jgi:hypothetical protein
VFVSSGCTEATVNSRFFTTVVSHASQSDVSNQTLSQQLCDLFSTLSIDIVMIIHFMIDDAMALDNACTAVWSEVIRVQLTAAAHLTEGSMHKNVPHRSGRPSSSMPKPAVARCSLMPIDGMLKS